VTRWLENDWLFARRSKSRSNRAWGLCTHCGKQPVPGKRYCQTCADMNRVAVRGRAERLRAEGRCRDCGCAPLATTNHCRACADRRASAVARKRKAEAAAEKKPQ
jgi:hypothetical protein